MKLAHPVVGIKVKATRYEIPAWKARYGDIIARVWAPNDERDEWAASWDNLDSIHDYDLHRGATLPEALQIFVRNRSGTNLAIGRALARAFIQAIEKDYRK